MLTYFYLQFLLLLFFRISIAKSRENMRWMISWCSPCAAFTVYPPTWLGHNLRNPCRGVGSLVVVWFQSDISQTFCNKCSRKGHLTVCAGFGRGPHWMDSLFSTLIFFYSKSGYLLSRSEQLCSWGVFPKVCWRPIFLEFPYMPYTIIYLYPLVQDKFIAWNPSLKGHCHWLIHGGVRRHWTTTRSMGRRW